MIAAGVAEIRVRGWVRVNGCLWVIQVQIYVHCQLGLGADANASTKRHDPISIG